MDRWGWGPWSEIHGQRKAQRRILGSRGSPIPEVKRVRPGQLEGEGHLGHFWGNAWRPHGEQG